MAALTHLVCVIFFLRDLLMLWPPQHSVVFRPLVCLGSFPVCCHQNSERSNALFCCQLPTDFHKISIVSKVFERLVSVRLGRFKERGCVLPTAQFAYQKGLLHFGPIHCKVYWRVGWRLGSCGLISVQPLIESTIGAFSISSARWVLEVLCCIY